MAPTSNQRLMLLDTASLYYRAFFGVPATITSPNGQPTNAVRGLIDFIARLVTDYQPTDLVAAWDNDWRPEWRVALVPDYKAHRVELVSPASSDPGTARLAEQVPDELAHQIELIVELLAASGICVLGADQFEADDVIGTLAARAECPTLVVTGDRDLFQVIDDSKPTKIIYTASRGVANAEVITNTEIQAKYGISANQYAEFALLRGDPSDGLPGVRGIGEKTAAKLLAEFGTIDNLYTAVNQGISCLSPALTSKLEAGQEYIERARSVVEVRTDLEFGEIHSALPAVPAHPTQLAKLTENWGLESSIDRLASSLSW